MSNGASGVVAGIGGMGIVYLVALPIAQAILIVAAAWIVVIFVTVGLMLTAGMVWFKYMRIAIENQDWGFVRDLCLVPTFAILAAAIYGGTDVGNSGNAMILWGAMQIISLHQLLVFIVLPLAFVVLVFVMLHIPKLLVMRAPLRYLAYPAYIFFTLELTSFAMTMANTPI